MCPPALGTVWRLGLGCLTACCCWAVLPVWRGCCNGPLSTCGLRKRGLRSNRGNRLRLSSLWILCCTLKAAIACIWWQVESHQMAVARIPASSRVSIRWLSLDWLCRLCIICKSSRSWASRPALNTPLTRTDLVRLSFLWPSCIGRIGSRSLVFSHRHAGCLGSHCKLRQHQSLQQHFLS